MNATIFALASGPGRAGIAVWRLSGPAARATLITLAGALPSPRQARRALLRDRTGAIIDDGLVLWFPAPASLTGEDVVELHLHGGRAVATAIAEELLGQGLRPAEPGEFLRRAVGNGKTDLARAEAVADLVEAETAAQRRQALRQMAGGLSTLVEGWRARLVSAEARLVALIDFADEDLPDDLAAGITADIADLARAMTVHLDDNRQGERLRDGFAIAILGAPNAGKSSLLNRIAGREAAIVSSLAGTTRDVIEAHLDLGGWPVTLADTAGLREAEGEIEAEGIRRALARAEAADLKLCVFDAARLPELDGPTRALIDAASLVVMNKTDLTKRPLPSTLDGRPVLALSAGTGQGIDALLERIGLEAETRMGGSSAVLTRARHRAALVECHAALARFDLGQGPELAAEDVRLAGRALGRITGSIDIEELLDSVFRDFCIGK